MSIKRGDMGIEVKKLQDAIIKLGYPMPRWGADGSLGSETLSALSQLLQDHGKKFDDDDNSVSDAELSFVYSLKKELRNDKGLFPPVSTDMFFDLRSTASLTHIIRKRTWKEVTGICLHQTACVLGEKPQRWNDIGAHLGVTRAGKVIWMHDFEYAVVHGNGWNTNTVGIEMDGTYAGIEGNLKTFWRPQEDQNRKPQSPTPELIKSSKATIRWICAEVSRHGGKVTKLVAHRQSSKTRQSDPGSALWQAVAMPLHKELGLDDGGKDFKIGTGTPIPFEWDNSRVGIKY